MIVLTTEVILGTALTSVSALTMVGSLIIMRPPKDQRSDIDIDIDALVRNATYHRLREVGIRMQEPVQRR